MTVKEAIEHDWKVGEKLWEVYFSLEENIPGKKPLGIIEVEVTKVERNDKWKDRYEYVELRLNGDFNLNDDDNFSDNNVLSAIVNHYKWGDVYDHQDFCVCKFFTKEEAEKRLKSEVKKWNNHLKEYKKNLKYDLEEAKKELEDIEKAISKADVESPIDYKDLLKN